MPMKIQTHKVNQFESWVKKEFFDIMIFIVKDAKSVPILWNQVKKHYGSPDRAYHNFEHLYNMLLLWRAHNGIIIDSTSAFLSIIYHDIIYNAKRSDNEEKSVSFFISKVIGKIKIGEIRIKRVCETILATKHNDEARKYWEKNEDIRLILDFDLCILASKENHYNKYRKGVRKEYKHVPIKLFKAGRRAVLQSFLKREKIFLNNINKNLEKKARKNLRNEIKLYLC